ncbi:unnamed protein product [Musa banksii]
MGEGLDAQMFRTEDRKDNPRTSPDLGFIFYTMGFPSSQIEKKRRHGTKASRHSSERTEHIETQKIADQNDTTSSKDASSKPTSIRERKKMVVRLKGERRPPRKERRSGFHFVGEAIPLPDRPLRCRGEVTTRGSARQMQR